MQGRFQIPDLMPLISWEHFFFAWKVKSHSCEAEDLQRDAIGLVEKYGNEISVGYVLQPYVASVDTDDIIIGGKRITFLRQQVPNADGSCLCISDFVCNGDTVGVFATSVKHSCRVLDSTTDDPYTTMLLTTISDRLAEAAAEQVQKEAVKTMDFKDGNVIRPAVGYPSVPDMSINFLLNELCRFDQIGITLTETGMMRPHSSVSGFIISHPQARYFSVGQISKEQVEDYANRRGQTLEETMKYIYA